MCLYARAQSPKGSGGSRGGRFPLCIITVIFIFIADEYRACTMKKRLYVWATALWLVLPAAVMAQQRRIGMELDVALQIATAKPLAGVFPVNWSLGIGPRWGFSTADRLWVKLNFGLLSGASSLDGDSYTETLTDLRVGPEFQYEAWRSDAVSIFPLYRLDFSYTFNSERTGGVFANMFNEETEHVSNFFTGGGVAQTVGVKALFDDRFFVHAGYTFYHPLLRNRNADYQGNLGNGLEDFTSRRFNLSTISVGVGFVVDFWND